MSAAKVFLGLCVGTAGLVTVGFAGLWVYPINVQTRMIPVVVVQRGSTDPNDQWGLKVQTVTCAEVRFRESFFVRWLKIERQQELIPCEQSEFFVSYDVAFDSFSICKDDATDPANEICEQRYWLNAFNSTPTTKYINAEWCNPGDNPLFCNPKWIFPIH